jgi:hypothetical protein
MTSNSESTIGFINVKNIRSEINTIFHEIDNKIKKLNAIHIELVKSHKHSNYRFGLDSFNFQNRMIQFESDNMKNIFIYIDNRIYCEYYKLYRIVCDYINNDLNDKTLSDKLVMLYKKFPIYKDLEPTKVYEFNITSEINNCINQFINELVEYLNNKKHNLEHENKQAKYGIYIHNLINEHEYKNSLIEEKINMFTRYLNNFNSHHTKYLSRLLSKLKLMNDIINEDIHLQEKPSLHNITTDEPIIIIDDIKNIISDIS